jgi:Protein of unknown function (DUF1559)
MNSLPREDSKTAQLPSPLPHPLSDPLRTYRRLLTILLVLLFILSNILCLLPPRGGRTLFDTIYRVNTILSFFILTAVWRLMPRKPTAAIYLRSFMNDPATYPIRIVASAALGRSCRLSGIRDPRRRWPWLIQHLLGLIFFVKYLSPRFMNLEAGPDWKARLWRSLGQARCALIDVTDLTPFVHEEIDLALQCLGPERVLFIVDATLNLAAWEEKIASGLVCPVATDDIRLAVWENTQQGRKSFANQIRHFAARLPEKEAGLKAAAWPLTQSQQPIEGRSGGQWEELREFVLAMLVGLALVVLCGWLAGKTPNAVQFLWLVPSVGLYLLCAVFLLQYLIEAGSRRDLVLTLLLLGFGCLAAIPIVIQHTGLPECFQEATAQTASSSNLRQIGEAIVRYQAANNHLPPAVTYSKDGKPLLSWRVALLPYLEQNNIYVQFHLDEPWDSPHNKSLLEHVLKVYHSPYSQDQTELTRTHYRVVVGRNTLFGDDSPATGLPFRLLFTDVGPNRINPAGGVFGPDRKLPDRGQGLPATILVVEAKDAVPWTKPEELEFEALDLNDLPRRLGVSKKGFNSVYTDGSTHFHYWSEKRSAKEWEALITGASPAAEKP